MEAAWKLGIHRGIRGLGLTCWLLLGNDGMVKKEKLRFRIDGVGKGTKIEQAN